MRQRLDAGRSKKRDTTTKSDMLRAVAMPLTQRRPRAAALSVVGTALGRNARQRADMGECGTLAR
jgi:hypothetical protein